MRWIQNPFVGNSAAGTYAKTKRRIDHRKTHKPVWVLALNENSKGLMELIPSPVLLQKQYPTNSLLLIGMAGSKSEAMEMASQIITMAHTERRDFDVQQYIQTHDTGA